MIISGVAFIFMCMLKETYAPALLRKKAKLRREEQDDKRYWSRYDNKIKFWPLLIVNLSRPFVMVFTEPVSTLSRRLSSLPYLLSLITRCESNECFSDRFNDSNIVLKWQC